jgi:poly-gamma-glutamate synthesis protein (capsule biosynthesis protein)
MATDATLSIVACGDVMPGAELGAHIGSSSIQDWVENASSAWREADLVIGNLECPCVTEAQPDPNALAETLLYAPQKRLVELAAAGFSALTIANNHILNCGPIGLMETIEGLNRAGLYYTGAGMNLAEAATPAFIPIRGMTVGLTAFCYGPPAGNDSPGVAPSDFKTMRAALSAARRNADVVIAALHDGLEYSDVPPRETRARFRFLAENGADIVIGHHPHVLQGLEWIGNVPVAYSLGDFLFDNSLPHVAQANFARMAMGIYAPNEIKRDPDKFKRGAFLTIAVSRCGKSVRWHPFTQGPDLRPHLCRDDSRTEDLRKLEDLSAALLDDRDPRHALADSVMKNVRRATLARLGVRDVMRLALRPKWRYVPRGLSWCVQRVKNAIM